MKVILKVVKIFLTLLMIGGITFSIFNFYSLGTNAADGASVSVKKGLLIADEITGDKVCMGQGNECDLPPDSPIQ